MHDTPIAIPTFASKGISATRCRHCLQPLRRYTVQVAGIEYSQYTTPSFFYRVTCANCRKTNEASLPPNSLSPHYWARQIADATPAPRPPTRKRANVAEQPHDPDVPKDRSEKMDGPIPERPEYRAFPVALLDCTPANYDDADGEEVTVVTVGKADGSIEPLVLSLDDTRRLVVKLLTSLATYDDELAKTLLDEHFATDGEGRFMWPKDQ